MDTSNSPICQSVPAIPFPSPLLVISFHRKPGGKEKSVLVVQTRGEEKEFPGACF